mmetsp:Transcript_5552/g.9505  ORF Transcript_5552/g.9505 Transcript_5552/m.9505 type:complete len:175 (+) Transcript_5552:18-542(+)
MSTVYIYGNGDCDQLGLGEDSDAPFELKKPRKVQILGLNSPLSIIKIICGSYHTVALSNDGSVFTWGGNDDGALGRDGSEKCALRVDGQLNIPATDISAGDRHTIAYNVEQNKIFYWGCYLVDHSGKKSTKVSKPIQIATELFNTNTKLKLKKVTSGQDHTLALTECGKVYAWG